MALGLARTLRGMRRSQRQLRLVMFIVTAVVLTGAVLTAYGANVFRDSELDTVDTRFSIRGERPTPKNIVVVAVDDVSFGELRRRWPFPRSLHGRAIDRLRADGAKTIAYDVQFTEPSENPDEDNTLIDAVARARNVVLATTEADNGKSGVFGGGNILREVGARAGHALLPNDPGGVLRRMPYEVDGLESFGVAAAETFTKRQVGGEGTEWIDYAGPPGTIDTVSYSRVVNGGFSKGTFADKLVVVGPSAPSLQDVHPTSASGDDLMSGAEIQANAADTVLRGFPLGEAAGWVDVALILVMGLVGPLAAIRLGPALAALLGVLVAAVYVVGVQLAFNSGTIVALLAPMASLVLGVVGAMAIGLVVAAFERERVRDLFSRFVPEQVVGEVLAQTGDELRLGGEERTATLLFSDLRGFTTFSESRSPEEVIEILNRYLTAMTEVIMGHGGTLVCYMGDGIMAVFGAPLDQEDHADRALSAAREMTGGALERFNTWMQEAGHGDGFRMGVGLNTGPVMSGNVGSEQRMEYTTIGDTVNTAARLEGMTKGTPYMVYVADSTRTLLTGDPSDLEKAGDLEVRGKQTRVTVWGVPEGDRASTTAVGG